MAKRRRPNQKERAAKKRQYVRERRKHGADMGKAKPLARMQAPLCEEMHHNAPNAPGGSLTTTAGRTPISDSLKWVCTSAKVPWPVSKGNIACMPGLADQTKLANINVSIIQNYQGAQIQKQTKSKDSDTIIKQDTNRMLNEIDCRVNQNEERIRPDEELQGNLELPSVQGNFHQAHLMFGNNAGSQCVANCLSAASYNCIKDPLHWHSTDLDKILTEGNNIYSSVRKSMQINENLLLISELPKKYNCHEVEFEYEYAESIASIVDIEELQIELADYCALPLTDAITQSLCQNTACFVCFDAKTILVGKTNAGYYVFDSHSRSEHGMFDVDGKSCCIQFQNIKDVYSHLKCLAMSFGCATNIECEVTGVVCSDFRSQEISSIASSDYINLDPSEANNLCISNDQSKRESKAAINDVILMEMVESNTTFAPLTTETKTALCEHLSVPFSSAHDKEQPVQEKAGKPNHIQKITGDGNCFFRAMSFCICSTEDYHTDLRNVTCNYIEQNQVLFQTILRDQNCNVKEYVQRSKMYESGTWATEVELIALAHLLQIDIFTFSNNTWKKYSGKLVDINLVPNTQSVYLSHTNNTHYDVVLTVHMKTNEEKKQLQKHTDQRLEKNTIGKSVIKLNRKEMHRAKCREAGRKRYAEDREYRERKKARSSENYREKMKYKEATKANSKMKYREDQQYRVLKQEASITKYKNNEQHRQAVKVSSKSKYKEDEHHRQAVKVASKTKYKENEHHRQAVKVASKTKYKTNEHHRQAVKVSSKTKYKENEHHRQAVKVSSKTKYKENEHHRQAVKVASKTKYKEDEHHRQAVKVASKTKYKENEHHRQAVKVASKTKYKEDEHHRQAVKVASKTKYKEDENHRQAVKAAAMRKYEDDVYREAYNTGNRRKYRENELFRDARKAQFKQKYKEDGNFSLHQKQRSLQKYKEDKDYAKQIKTKKRQKYIETKQNLCDRKKHVTNIVNAFECRIKNGPSYVCSCCCRLLFENQVVVCNQNLYKTEMKAFISNKYHHEKCMMYCNTNCKRTTQWICKTCHNKLRKGEIPAESSSNNLSLEEIPEELKKLNSLEKHLVSLQIPFMKVMALPRGGQSAIQGQVVCVPTDMIKVSSLPRAEDENKLIRVKLKRKITFKGHYDYQYVSTKNVMEALWKLKETNKWYNDLQIDKNWAYAEAVHECSEDDCQGLNDNTDNQRNMVVEDEGPPADCIIDAANLTDPLNIGKEADEHIQFDTCLQPVDIGQEVLDHHFNEIFNLAPSEGKNPVRILQESGSEAKSFPVHFPTGINTCNEVREKRITLSRYFNNRLMHVDSRFAEDTNYIFYSQYVSELKQVIDKTQISMRKGKNTQTGNLMEASSLQNPEKLKKMLKNDEAFRFMQPIRGTPAYWQSAQKDLFAMLRQLGIPTWFCSFSAAEFKWHEMIDTILEQQNDARKAKDLNWKEKSDVLKSNPVTVARMFDHRFHAFLNEVILTPAQPIGKVIDYFQRVEFQQRGSPHMHCLFWVENAPKLDKNNSDEICQFIDRYVTCQIPSENQDPVLRQVVMEVQQHSKNHSKSCKTKGTNCRFNFPRPPSEKTFVATPNDGKDNDTTEGYGTENDGDWGRKVMEKIWKEILDETVSVTSTTELFNRIGVSQEMFEKAFSSLSQKQSVVLKRNVDELWTNQFNPVLLKCWKANMDIQYVLDPYSCIVYIISYISKAEREMGMLLRQTKLEAEEGNLSARDTLKKIGSAYLHHREVSVQEAVYRVCNLRMKQCSRKVMFIPVGENPTRLSKPLSQIQKDQIEEDNEEIWMTNIVDRYQARPNDAVFNEMCLAMFCSEYRVLAKSQIPSREQETVFELQNGNGFIQKRTRTQAAVVRFPKFNEEKSPEEYFQAKLQLFLPYRALCQLKPPHFETYKDFYDLGYIKCSDTSPLQAVKLIVNSNQNIYSKYECDIQLAEEQVENLGVPEDAWAMLCPESEVNRKECLEEKVQQSEKQTDDLIESSVIDLTEIDSAYSQVLFDITNSQLPRDEAMTMMKSLNDKQKAAFYIIRDWTLSEKWGKNPEPFHIFITGGAGTGKSHLIKAIMYESNRLLVDKNVKPDNGTVLLTAYTGTAAFGIGGCTLHHAFSLNLHLPLPYEPLGEQMLNSLRTKYENLKILIIDEISMVYKKMLYYIHERLVQIKGDKRPFGGVSVIAVGDFYQLPPVKQSKAERLYMKSYIYPVDYWNDLFTMIELDEIMRQKEDKTFAEILNTIRTRLKTEILPETTKNLITKCLREGKLEDLHVFSTNAEVDAHNMTMLETTCDNIQDIEAKDIERDRKTGKMKHAKTHFSDKKTDGLAACLKIAVNAPVMLTRNCDVSDGLVNGVIGTVTDIILDSTKSEVKAIKVKFHNSMVGKKTGIRNKDGKHSVIIERAVEDIKQRKSGNNVRYQFPLKLAWACTAHKVQGMTVENIVVNLDKVFAPGQAYVALSRVTTEDGLSISTNKPETIDQKLYAEPDVYESLRNMSKVEKSQQLTCTANIMLHNTQGLKNSIEHIKHDKRFICSDLICLTETWLKMSDNSAHFQLEKFLFHQKPRELAYVNKENDIDFGTKAGGGVCAYIHESTCFKEIPFPVKNVEGMLIQNTSLDLIIGIVYRPPSYCKKAFMNNLQKIISFLQVMSSASIVMGDFNEDISCSDGPIAKYMTSNGYKQLVTSPTTEGGTLIDHVYATSNLSLDVSTVPTYYSYHEAVCVKLMPSRK